MQFDPSLQLTPYDDRVSTGFSRYQHPYYSDPETNSYYSRQVTDIPRALPLSARKLLDEQLKCDRNLNWSIDWATAFFVDHLDPKNTPDAQDTLRKICSKVNQLANEGRGSEIPFLAFKSLNQTLFAGYLKDAVHLKIETLGSDVPGATFTHSHGPDARVRRISIILNADVIHNVGGRVILACLIHEMIHAYFLVACGPQEEKEVQYGRLGHGMPFLKIVKTIHELCTHKEKPWLPPLRTPLRRRAFYYHGRHRQQPPDHYRELKDEWFCSHCDPQLPMTAPNDIEKYYKSVCKPLVDLPESIQRSTVFIFNKRNELELVPRGEAAPSTESVEFMLMEKDREKAKSVLVPKSCIENYPRIRYAFDKAKCRYLEMKMDKVHLDGLMAMLQLLHNGSYLPDVGPVAGAGMQGPPVIKPVRANSPSYLMTDIRLFKLAQEMSFEDVGKVAVSRMKSQTVMHEDPVPILKEIYGKGDPPGDLRKWAQAFLLQVPKEESSQSSWGLGVGETLGVDSGHGRMTEPPNLWKLKTEFCFKEGFLSLVEKCGALHIDVLKAEEVLARRGISMGNVSSLLPGLGVPHAALGIGGMGGVGVPTAALGAGLGVGMGMQVPTRGPGLGLGWRDDWDVYERERERERYRAYPADLMSLGLGSGEYDDPRYLPRY